MSVQCAAVLRLWCVLGCLLAPQAAQAQTLPQLSFTGARDIGSLSSAALAQNDCPRSELTTTLDKISEGETLALAITRSMATASATISVDFEILSGSAAKANDLASTRNTLLNAEITFPSGQVTQCHYLDIARDTKLEGDETLSIRIKAKPSAYTIKASERKRDITIKEVGAAIRLRHKNIGTLGGTLTDRSFTVTLEAGVPPSNAGSNPNTCNGFVRDTTFTRDVSMGSGNPQWRVRDGQRTDLKSAGLQDFDFPGKVSFKSGLAEATVTAKADADQASEDFRIDLAPQGSQYPIVICEPTTVNAPRFTIGPFGVIPPSVPGAPTGLGGTPGDQKVTLSWDNPGNTSITGYELRYSKVGENWSSWSNIDGATAATTSHPVTNLENGSQYRFRIRAKNDTGAGGASAVFRATPFAPVSLSISDVSATEGATFTFTVRATPSPSVNADFKYTVTAQSGDTATADTDFTTVTTATTATIAAGETSTTISVTVADDNIDEENETFTVTLSEPSAGVTISDTTARGTIVDNDTAGVTLSETSLTIAEGGSRAYTVRLDTEPSGDVTVTVGGASGDVTVQSSTLTFTASDYAVPQTVTVSAADDEDTETDANVILTHSASGGGYGSVRINSVTVSITDTTPVLELATDPDAVAEGAEIRLTVTSSRTLTGTLQVRLTLSDRGNSGFEDGDISGELGPRQFDADFGSAGSATGTVTIATVLDSVVEGAETYRITLHDAPGYAPGADVTADGTLNDSTNTIAVQSSMVSVTEGTGTNPNATVTIAASEAPGQQMTFTVTYGGTEATGASDPADGDYDNDAVTSVVFGAANTTRDIAIPIHGDRLDEGDGERFTVTITLSEGSLLPKGWTLGTVTTTVTITDDDSSPELEDLVDQTVTVGQEVEIIASATDNDGDTVTYAWTRKEGETAPSLPPGTALNQARLAFTPTGPGRYTMTVTASDGNTNTDAAAVTITVTALTPAGGGPTTSPGTTRASVTVSKAALTVDEGASGAYTVKLDTAPSGPVTVTVGGAAGDVTVAPERLIFTASNYHAPQTVTVSAARDEDTDTDPDVTLTHSAAGGGYDPVTIASVVVSVTDTTPALQLLIDPDAVNEGTEIRLTVTSDRALTDMLAISLALADRGASGFDANDIPGTLGPRTFNADFGAASGLTGTVMIPTTADTAPEGTETYTITLHDAAGYALGADVEAEGTLSDGLSGSVARANKLHATLLPRVTAAAVSQTLGAIEGRIGTAVSCETAAGAVRFGALPSAPVEDGRTFPHKPEPAVPSMRDILDGASFTLPLGASGSDGPSSVAVWGRSDWLSLSGSEKEVFRDGGLWTAQLGADLCIRPSLLAGTAVSYAEGDIDAGTHDDDGRLTSAYETMMTSINPYVAWRMTDSLSLWGSLGYGRGEAQIVEENGSARTTDLSWWSAATGGRGILIEDAELIKGGVTRLAVKSEGAVARLRADADDDLVALTVDVARLRLMLEGSHERVLENGATLAPALEAGVRYDGGDATEGAGIEVGSRLTWLDPTARLTMELHTRMLAVHEAERDEWGVSALMRLDPKADGRGTFLNLHPSHGRARTVLGQLFEYDPAMAGVAAEPADRKNRLEAEIGHGFGIFGSGPLAVLTPYAGLSLAESDARTLRLGVRYRMGANLDLGVEGLHRPGVTGERSLMLRGALRW